MSDEVTRKIIEIIAGQAVLEPEQISLDSTLEDLGVDSLALVEAVFAIEEAFDISIPFNANDPTDSEFDISNVGAMVAAVKGLIAAKEG